MCERFLTLSEHVCQTILKYDLRRSPILQLTFLLGVSLINLGWSYYLKPSRDSHIPSLSVGGARFSSSQICENIASFQRSWTMALIKCPECNNDVSTIAASCPKCGAPIASQNGHTAEQTIPKWKVQCRHCHAIVTPQRMQAGCSSLIIAILLLCLGIIPGVIYIIWESSRKQCPNCKLPIG